MPKIIIEIDDALPAHVESAIDQVKDLLIAYLSTNDCEELPCLHNDLDYSGRVHEIVDGAVPIYTKDIETAWFLHGRDLEEAYESAGVGSNPRENNGGAAIYFYIHQKVCEWYSSHADEVFEESKANREGKE